MYTINFWPILVASAVSFLIGSVWYSPFLFGKDWMTLSNKTASDIASIRSIGSWKAYVAQFIAIFITFAVLGFLIAATGATTATDGAFLAFLVWFGFVLTDAVGIFMWERKPMKLVLINIVATLLTLVIGGAIIGAWS